MKHGEFFYLLIIIAGVFLTFVSITNIIGHAQSRDKVEWSYSGKTGPQFWGSLDSDYVQCSKGVNQSPININTANETKTTDLELNFDYTNKAVKVSNTGKTISVVPLNKENILRIDGTTNVLKEIHFHYPSEHEINDRKYPIEIHFVHSNPEGNLIVVGVFVKEGSHNEVLEKIFENLRDKGISYEIIKGKTNLSALLPDQKSFITYEGSLTTPPCTEGVTWFILKEAIEMDASQIKSLKNLFPSNARPLQSRNNREILKSQN